MALTELARSDRPLRIPSKFHGKIAVAKMRRDKALVLKTSKLGESDRIISLLTEAHGLIRGVAKSVRKTNSRFGARLEPFMYCDVSWAERDGDHRSTCSGSLSVISQAELVRSYGVPIVKKYDAYIAAGTITEVASILSDGDVASTSGYYYLTHGALAALARQSHSSELIVNSYLMRVLGLAGWSINLQACSRCSSPDFSWFSVAWGGVVCRRCRPTQAIAVDRKTLYLLAALAQGDWRVADSSEKETRARAFTIITRYIVWHLGVRIKSLQSLSGRAVSLGDLPEAISASQ